MKINETIGIDISKLKLDVRIHSTQSFAIFENSKQGFKQLTKWVSKNSPHLKENILYVMEHTGRYSYNITQFLSEKNLAFTLVPGLEIKRSLGIRRGKDDKIDATKIALYGYRLRDEIKPTKLPDKEVITLKQLLSLRDRMVKQRAGYKASLKEDKAILPKKGYSQYFKYQESIIIALSKQIEKINQQMIHIVKETEKLKFYYDLMLSIKGIGSQTALYILVYTHGFIKFKNARKFASYCGIAPFPNSSGTSLRGKTKVSNLANKKMKTLLDLCAKSASQHNYEMKIYYEKRILNDKNKMSTLNIIRNKLLARVFAVVNRGTPYVNTYKYAS